MGCKRLDAVTYPHEGLREFVRDTVIPVRVQSNQRGVGARFNIRATPTLLLLDARGNVIYRNEGFLPPERLIPALILGVGKERFLAGQFDDAISHFNRLAFLYPSSEEAPEAIYYAGLARFNLTHDPKAMREAHEKLSNAYPTSSWTEKAQFYGSWK
jgi:hypothetical protein